MKRAELKVIAANAVMTVLFAGLFAPAGERFTSAFGLTSWSAVAPFFILPLYIGPTILALKPIGRWQVRAGLVGFLFVLPLACWTVLPNYPVATKVPIVLGTGVVQGLLLGWLAGGEGG
jgi:hypothetical protein